MASSASSTVVSATVNSTSPVTGVLAASPGAPGSPSVTWAPIACSATLTRSRRSSADGCEPAVGFEVEDSEVFMVVMMSLSRRGSAGLECLGVRGPPEDVGARDSLRP
jgi:hypothetical protein